MRDFEEWIQRFNPEWTYKAQHWKRLYLPPQTMLIVEEYHLGGWRMYHSPEESDPAEKAQALYGMIHDHMSIAMERELIKILEKNLKEWEDSR
jgi:hypothetical protein